ncbi:unnamed protein product [Bursaphelenchus okinawaensis]|uniref:DNA replication complex GINS protein PSF1 n=1 Tax=Bursaphelenchus okinawaensis TaxID=465554 RepID=A0A811JUR9_9BILA|nr:unnamed protein product [Bursaphelenchus okinawaensis]CAG9083369.1 unnamed protein product [Bursaphelenchus okinawaensis]
MAEENKSINEVLAPVEKIVEALKELQNDIDFLPPYREEVVKGCAEEIRRLYALNDEAIKNASDTNSPEFQIIRVRQTMMDRLKRCCLAYLNERIRRIKEFKWTHAGALSTVLQANMSDKERVWLKEYTGSLFSYQQNIGRTEDDDTDGVNLTEAVNPPRSNLVPVCVLKDYGDIETIDGAIVIMKEKTVHCIPRIDIEPLIRKDIIKLV